MPLNPTRRCINHPDNCYTCGEYIPPTHRTKLSSKITLGYAHYFGCKVGVENKGRPHIFVATVAEHVFCFGLMEKGSKCYLVFQ